MTTRTYEPAPTEGRVVVVVESPTRALALRRVVGPSVRVLATAGGGLGGRRGPRRGGGRVLQELVAAGRTAERVLLATDPDREGEAIAAELLRFLAPLFPGRVSRVHLDDDSAAGVVRALGEARPVDRGRLAARALRDEVDRRFLAAAGRVLGEADPCGRVRALALGRVVERSVREPARWSVEVWLELPEGRWKVEVEGSWASEAEAAEVAAALAGQVLWPDAIRRRRYLAPPPPPFDTAALLAAADTLGLGPERVLEAARALHRGVELADGVEALLSYPRTDEATLEPAGEGARPRAHGAIRPVAPEWPPERAAPFLGAAERKVYACVWRRTEAARARPAELEAIEVEAAVNGHPCRARAARAIEPGQAARVSEPGQAAPAARRGGVPRLGRARAVVRPGPGPYRPGELIADLAAAGIGRPSTWAGIARGLREAGWVRGEGGRLWATDEGRRVDGALRQAFGAWLARENAAALEAGLRAVEEGRLGAAEFRRRFVASLDAVGGSRGPRCPACGRPLAGGSCTGFPVCRGRG